MTAHAVERDLELLVASQVRLNLSRCRIQEVLQWDLYHICHFVWVWTQRVDPAGIPHVRVNAEAAGWDIEWCESPPDFGYVLWYAQFFARFAHGGLGKVAVLGLSSPAGQGQLSFMRLYRLRTESDRYHELAFPFVEKHKDGSLIGTGVWEVGAITWSRSHGHAQMRCAPWQRELQRIANCLDCGSWLPRHAFIVLSGRPEDKCSVLRRSDGGLDCDDWRARANALRSAWMMDKLSPEQVRRVSRGMRRGLT